MPLSKPLAQWGVGIFCLTAALASLHRYWTPPWVLSELSMKFTHPELYESRDGLAMYTALHEFRRRGLLHRGMRAVDVRKLLGEPVEKSKLETNANAPNILWIYSLHASALTIEMDPDGSVLSFTHAAG